MTARCSLPNIKGSKMSNSHHQLSDIFARMGTIPTMQLFASTHCNLSCPYCSQGSAHNSSIVDDLLNTPTVLKNLHSWPATHFYISGGEPLIHDGIFDFIKETRELDHIISFDTNGVVSEKRLLRIIESLPREKFGFFNISHHILADVSLKTIQQSCKILREAEIPHFVKYVGTPETILSIKQNMDTLRNEGSGVAVTILETYSTPWNGRRFPKEYTDQELLSLLDMVTLGTHAMQFFGGIESKNHPCFAGSTYVAYNMKNKNELIPCCHSPHHINWTDTVFAQQRKRRYICNNPKCLGDLMFILGLQGVSNEIARLEQICRGNAPALGLETALEYVRTIADQVRLIEHTRFEKLYAAHKKTTSPTLPSRHHAKKATKQQWTPTGILHPATPQGKKGLMEFYDHFKAALATTLKENAPQPSYYYDSQRWSTAGALRNRAKHKAAQAAGLPLKVNVEVTTQCVFKCEFCVLHSGRLAKKREQLFLSYENFVRLFLQIQPFTTHIEFTGGEPLLNRDLPKMIALCNEAQIKTTIATNAKLLTATKVEELLTNAASNLLIAYESGQVKAYEHHRIGGKLEVLERNIKSFIHERDRETVGHMENFWRDAQLLDVDEACSKPIFVWPDGDKQYWQLMRQKYLIPDHPLSYYTTDDQGNLNETGIKGVCPNTSNVHLATDGQVVPCWYNLLSSPQIGNALDQPFVDIWFSETFISFREAMKNHTAYAHGCRFCIGIHKPELFNKKTFRQETREA